MATGDIIGILNSDDIYAHENVLKEIVKKFEQTKCDRNICKFNIYG